MDKFSKEKILYYLVTACAMNLIFFLRMIPEYFINKEDRTIKRVHPYSLRETPTDDEVLDLVQAGLVEKVGDNQ